MNYFTKKSITLTDWMDAAVEYGKVAIEKFASIHMDFPPTVLFGRDGRPMLSAGLTSSTLSFGDMFWNTMMVGCTGLDNDVTVVMLDTWAHLTDVNPDTGLAWTPEVMDTLVATDPTALDRGLVTECLATLVANRAGDVMSDVRYYRRHDGDTIEWTGPESDNRSTSDDNGLVVALRAAMLSGTYAQHHSKHHGGMDVIPQDELDRRVATYLRLQLDVIAMLIPPDPDVTG